MNSVWECVSRATQRVALAVLTPRYGKLRVVDTAGKRGHNKMLLCLCDCGATKEVLSSSVQSGRARSCGCLVRDGRPSIVMPGDRYGMLTVVRSVGTYARPPRGRDHIYLCHCDCGRDAEVKGVLLRAGVSGRTGVGTKSCGCLKRKSPANIKAAGESARNSLYITYRKSAKSRGIPFCLSRGEFARITSGLCHYCGDPPSGVAKGQTGAHGYYVYNGIDRIINSEGYVIGNVVASCFPCNKAKGSQTVDEFIGRAARITARHYGTATSLDLTAIA